MNRFDRVTSLLLLLQTRSVLTAGFLSEHFGVTERTIYRDIRTLENAGVPIGSETGVGYYLEKGYRLPPVSFTQDEAASLLLGEKLVSKSLDEASLSDFNQALNKVRAVMDSADSDYLSSLDADLAVYPTGSHFPLDNTDSQNPHPDVPANDQLAGNGDIKGDRWLRDCRDVLVRRQVVELEYRALSSDELSTREVEPIGLFYYSWHWHLIAWCRLREAYRDFRLDRIKRFSPQPEQVARRSRLTLQQYLDERPGKLELQEVVLVFGADAARFVAEQRYMFGFIDEEAVEDGVKMRFLTPVPDYMARWLLQYVDDVEIVVGDSIKESMARFSQKLFTHWTKGS